jgi:hypothetical protein
VFGARHNVRGVGSSKAVRVESHPFLCFIHLPNITVLIRDCIVNPPGVLYCDFQCALVLLTMA